jgi:hypothetical protein
MNAGEIGVGGPESPEVFEDDGTIHAGCLPLDCATATPCCAPLTDWGDVALEPDHRDERKALIERRIETPKNTTFKQV